MKQTLLAIFLSLSALCPAQHKLTPPTMQRASEALEYAKLHEDIKPDLNTISSTGQDNPATEKVSVFINLEEGYTADDLRKIAYITVDEEMSTCVLASLSAVNLIDLNNEPCIRRAEICQKLKADMNYARPSGNIEDVQNGFSHNGQTLSFDGSGVIVGMMDTGLEANHINFKKDNGTGATRIERLWWFKSNNGTYTEYTPDNISTFSTDDNSESHATHVAGIMAGSYKGDGDYSYISTPTGALPEMRTGQPIPYYGVATGADLALSVGDLYTNNILQGVRNIFDYAESVGKPAVVNLSLGHTYGPHDGTDAYSRELAVQGRRGIICMSAGNDGDVNISIVKNITSDSGEGSYLKTFLHGNASNVISGIADLWGTDNTVLNVQWGVYSISAGTFTPVITINSADRSVSTIGVADFTSYFDGSITARSYIDPNNNRFEVYTEFNSVSQKTADKVIALNVTGAKTGQKLYLYSSTKDLTYSNRPTPSSTATISGFTNGSPQNSINDGACAENVIAVGAYVSRTTCGVLTSGSYYPAPSGYSVGAIAPFSSYGTKFDGTTLPDVCAPGARIVSSYSSYYVTAGSASGNMVGKVSNGRFNITTYYWGTMNGTSMSCPFVTGTIGLWLQADPTLDFDRVMEVIKNTSQYNSFTMGRDRTRWGAGKIDALEGIKYVLQHKAAIGEVWADPAQRFILTATADGYEAFIAGAAGVRVSVYDLQGRLVASSGGDSDAATVATASLHPGVYILEATADDGQRFTRKITR